MILKDVLNRMVEDEWMTLCIQSNGRMRESSLDELGPNRVGLSQWAESPALLPAFSMKPLRMDATMYRCAERAVDLRSGDCTNSASY